MKLRLERTGLDIRRSFDPGDVKFNAQMELLSKFTGWQELERLLRVRGLNVILKNINHFFANPTILPWHLKILLSRVISSGGSGAATYTGVYRHTLGYNYYEMLSEAKTVQLPPPKFELALHKPRARIKQLPLDQQRGIADTVLALVPALANLPRPEAMREALCDYTVCTRISGIRSAGPEKWTFQIDWSVTFNAKYDREVITVSSPSGAKESVLIASRPFARAFHQIADLWHKPGFENFLVVAPPGSGKEVLVKALATGLRIEYVPFLLGTQLSEAVEAKLFGNFQTKALLSGYSHKKNGAALGKHDRGDALIFFDEIDKCSISARGALLRLLESKDYFDGQAGEIRNLKKGVKFGFAGSLPFPQMRKLEPADFWTRIQQNIVMDHPLTTPQGAGSSGELRKILSAYFRVFWRISCKKAKEDSAISGFEYDVIEAIEEWERARKLSDAFARALGSPFTRTMSVRELRSLVQHVFSVVYSKVLEGHTPVDTCLLHVCNKLKSILHLRWNAE